MPMFVWLTQIEYCNNDSVCYSWICLHDMWKKTINEFKQNWFFKTNFNQFIYLFFILAKCTFCLFVFLLLDHSFYNSIRAWDVSPVCTVFLIQTKFKLEGFCIKIFCLSLYKRTNLNLQSRFQIEKIKLFEDVHCKTREAIQCRLVPLHI